jgi:4-carboxymuconolactone decarboxylase
VSRPARWAGSADWLARAAAGDTAAVASGGGCAAGAIEESGLDARSYALVGLAALVAAGEPGTGYDRQVALALDHGVTPGEIAGVLIALRPLAGAARIAPAARAVLAALDQAAAGLPASGQADHDNRTHLPAS